MLKAYAMAIAVSAAAPVTEKANESVSAPVNTVEAKTVITDTTKTELFSWMFANKKNWR